MEGAVGDAASGEHGGESAIKYNGTRQRHCGFRYGVGFSAKDLEEPPRRPPRGHGTTVGGYEAGLHEVSGSNDLITWRPWDVAGNAAFFSSAAGPVSLYVPQTGSPGNQYFRARFILP